ncbi:MAG: LytTR family transcriptional regulator [Treponema sp.]|jgi:DNA-binding LytR/AlgR family response regulator|nr:LytTR family transcriptional regulator [Treponema sp.]
MIFKLEQDAAQNDIEIVIKYPAENKNIDDIVSFLKTFDTQIECYSRNGIKKVNVSDIYYIESKDKLAVVFCENESYQTNFRLYQINQKLKDKGFVQVSKYCILNINKLDKFKPLLNSRMEAVLTNGARIYINRNYLANIKRKFQNDE